MHGQDDEVDDGQREGQRRRPSAQRTLLTPHAPLPNVSLPQPTRTHSSNRSAGATSGLRSVQFRTLNPRSDAGDTPSFVVDNEIDVKFCPDTNSEPKYTNVFNLSAGAVAGEADFQFKGDIVGEEEVTVRVKHVHAFHVVDGAGQRALLGCCAANKTEYAMVLGCGPSRKWKSIKNYVAISHDTKWLKTI